MAGILVATECLEGTGIAAEVQMALQTGRDSEKVPDPGRSSRDPVQWALGAAVSLGFQRSFP